MFRVILDKACCIRYDLGSFPSCGRFRGTIVGPVARWIAWLIGISPAGIPTYITSMREPIYPCIEIVVGWHILKHLRPWVFIEPRR